MFSQSEWHGATPDQDHNSDDIQFTNIPNPLRSPSTAAMHRSSTYPAPKGTPQTRSARDLNKLNSLSALYKTVPAVKSPSVRVTTPKSRPASTSVWETVPDTPSHETQSYNYEHANSEHDDLQISNPPRTSTRRSKPRSSLNLPPPGTPIPESLPMTRLQTITSVSSRHTMNRTRSSSGMHAYLRYVRCERECYKKRWCKTPWCHCVYNTWGRHWEHTGVANKCVGRTSVWGEQVCGANKFVGRTSVCGKQVCVANKFVWPFVYTAASFVQTCVWLTHS